MMKFLNIASAFFASAAFLLPAFAQSTNPSPGRHLAETTYVVCHQVEPEASPKNPNATAPSFVDVSGMPSTKEHAIKVFLRPSHPAMPNIILSPEETESVAAYIVGLANKQALGAIGARSVGHELHMSARLCSRVA